MHETDLSINILSVYNLQHESRMGKWLLLITASVWRFCNEGKCISVGSWADGRRPHLSAPETGARISYQNLCLCHAFWYLIFLVQSQKLWPCRILLYSAPETSNHVNQMHLCHCLPVVVYISGVFHHLTVPTRSTKLRPRHAFISLFGVNLCILVYQNLPESDSGCFCGNWLAYQPVFHAVVYRYLP